MAWLKIFLTGREQKVWVENLLSGPRTVTSGVSQGSVLGPLLFLVYIQNLGEDVDSTIIVILKFIDDLKVIGSIKSENNIIVFQNNLEKIYEWANKNHMNWNNSKFQLLCEGPNIKIIEETSLFTPNYGDVISVIHCVKDLGIKIHPSLKYKQQLYSAVSKENKKSSWIFITFKSRDIIFLKKVWNSLVQCHLDYGSVLWTLWVLFQKGPMGPRKSAEGL